MKALTPAQIEQHIIDVLKKHHPKARRRRHFDEGMPKRRTVKTRATQSRQLDTALRQLKRRGLVRYVSREGWSLTLPVTHVEYQSRSDFRL